MILHAVEQLLGRIPASASAAEGAKAAAQGRVVVYWRPGCPFTRRLRLVLGGRARNAVWVNIWADPEAAVYVRSVNDGDETVPTVVIDGQPHTNPSPLMVRARL